MFKIAFLIIGLALFSNYSFSSDQLDTLCKDSIQINGNRMSTDDIKFYKSSKSLYTFGKSHKRGYFLNIHHEGLTTQLNLKFRPLDVKEHNDKFYVLIGHEIHIYSTLNHKLIKKIPSTLEQLEKIHQLAAELEIFDEKIYVAHGSLGIVVIDLESGKVLNSKRFNLPHEQSHISRATGIAIDQDKIFLAYDNVTYNFGTKKRAFEGLLIADLKLNKLKATPIKVKREALHEPSLDIKDGMLISQNLMNIYVYSTKTMMKDKYFWPKKRLYNFNGATIIGNPYIENRTIKGCFKTYYSDINEARSYYEEIRY